MAKRPEGIRPDIWAEQEGEFEIEVESVERHREKAKRLVSEELRGRARILVFDLGKEQDPFRSGDADLGREVQEMQFGGGNTYGEAMRHMLGFDQGDPQVTIWEAWRGSPPPNIPHPDVWLTTGGGTMPSELHPGKETENTPWLRRVVGAMEELREQRVPGVAVCLGHQLWQHTEGAEVGVMMSDGRRKREYGTPTLRKRDVADELQILQGFFDESGEVQVSASHSEGVLRPSDTANFDVVAWNNYMEFQAAAHAPREGQTTAEADAEDELVLSIQNHPEIISRWLHVIRLARGESMEKEGLNPKDMIFRNTERARSIWLRFLELTARRIQTREQ